MKLTKDLRRLLAEYLKDRELSAVQALLDSETDTPDPELWAEATPALESSVRSNLDFEAIQEILEGFPMLVKVKRQSADPKEDGFADLNYLRVLDGIDGKWVFVETDWLFSNHFNIPPVPGSKNGLKIMDSRVSAILNDKRVGRKFCHYCHKHSAWEAKICEKCGKANYFEPFGKIEIIRAEHTEWVSLTPQEYATLHPLVILQEVPEPDGRSWLGLHFPIKDSVIIGQPNPESRRTSPYLEVRTSEVGGLLHRRTYLHAERLRPWIGLEFPPTSKTVDWHEYNKIPHPQETLL